MLLMLILTIFTQKKSFFFWLTEEKGGADCACYNLVLPRERKSTKKDA